MKSIESHLLRRILTGQSIVWIIAAISVWYSQRGRLYSEFDNELKFISAALSFHVRRPGSDKEIATRWPQFNQENSGWYFQAWNADDSERARSANLVEAEQSLNPDAEPGPESFLSTEPVNRYHVINFTGPEGDNLRGVVAEPRNTSSRWYSAKSKGKEMDRLLVARTREPLDRELWILALTALLVGSLASAATALLIRSSVRQGMNPLLRLSRETGDIDTSNLEKRFDPARLPHELQPISRCLNELMERLESGFARERQFSSDLAHELRTPLAEIRTLQEFLIKWPEEATTAHHTEVLDSAVRMEEIIEALFNLTRWEKGLDKADTSDIQVAPVLNETIEQWTTRAGEKKIEFTNRVDDRLSLPADQRILQVMFSNLISNAVEYAPENSEIRIDFQEGTERELSFTNRVENFRKENLNRLTQRFWRSDESRSDGSHSGLGLSIVESCAGRIGWILKPELDEAQSLLSMRLLIGESEI